MGVRIGVGIIDDRDQVRAKRARALLAYQQIIPPNVLSEGMREFDFSFESVYHTSIGQKGITAALIATAARPREGVAR